MRGGESFLKARLGPQRVMCVSLFVCVSGGRLGESSVAVEAPPSA